MKPDTELEAQIRCARAELLGLCLALLDSPVTDGADVPLRDWASRAQVWLRPEVPW